MRTIESQSLIVNSIIGIGIVCASVFAMIYKWQVEFLILFASFALIESNQGQCGVVSTSKGLISGGRVSERGKWPWVAALFDTKTQKFFCGSSLISSRHVLTAAHCVQYKGMRAPINQSDVAVFFVRTTLSARFERGSFRLDAVDILVHPDWKPFEMHWDADIAIIKLSLDVTSITSIAPVCLWTGNAKMELEGTVVGY